MKHQNNSKDVRIEIANYKDNLGFIPFQYAILLNNYDISEQNGL